MTRMDINKYDKYLFLIIVSLVFGGFGGALMIIRVMAIFLLPEFVKKYKGCKDYLGKYYNMIVLFLIFCAISWLWSPDKEQGAKELLYYPVHLLIFLEILVFSRFAKKPLKSISWGWLVCASLTLIVAIWEITTGNHLTLSKFQAGDVTLNLNGVISEMAFAAVTFGNYNAYVTFLCLSLPFLFYFLDTNRESYLRVILALFAIASTIVTIMADASRGGLITFVVMSSIFLLMTKRSAYKTIIVVIAVLFVLYFLLPRLDTLFLGMSVKSEGDSLYTDEGRFVIWSDALEVLINYLFIGSGVGSIAAAMRQTTTTGITITHNMFLEILIQYGVFFFGVFIVFLLNLFRRGMKTKNKNIKILIYMAIITMPVYSIIDSGYLLNPDIYVAFSCFAVFAYIDKISPILITNRNHDHFR